MSLIVCQLESLIYERWLNSWNLKFICPNSNGLIASKFTQIFGLALEQRWKKMWLVFGYFRFKYIYAHTHAHFTMYIVHCTDSTFKHCTKFYAKCVCVCVCVYMYNFVGCLHFKDETQSASSDTSRSLHSTTVKSIYFSLTWMINSMSVEF